VTIKTPRLRSARRIARMRGTGSLAGGTRRPGWVVAAYWPQPYTVDWVWNPADGNQASVAQQATNDCTSRHDAKCTCSQD
jgi:hypothetical protein